MILACIWVYNYYKRYRKKVKMDKKKDIPGKGIVIIVASAWIICGIGILISEYSLPWALILMGISMLMFIFLTVAAIEEARYLNYRPARKIYNEICSAWYKIYSKFIRNKENR
jgi:hypothetical protein